jgi:hypothetical protein
LAQASQMMDHPKMRLMVDQSKLEEEHKALISNQKIIDPVERRKTRILDVLGGIRFNLILAPAALLIFLRLVSP